MTLLSETTNFGRRLRRLDGAVATLCVIFLAVTLLAQEQAVESLRFTLDALIGISIFLGASVVLAASAKATGLDQQIALVFSASPIRAIFAASIVGALSPFCSCGVVPIIAGLLMAGVPLAPVMAFCLASPLMDPSMFFLMLPIFGVHFTLAKLIFAVIIGATAGLGLHGMRNKSWLADVLRNREAGCCASSCGSKNPMEKQPVFWAFWQSRVRLNNFRTESIESGWFLIKWLTLAFFLESLMVAYIPAGEIGRLLGGNSVWAIPSSVVLGVPAYLNGYAAIPTISGLMELGMTSGAAMGFMIAGGISSIPAAMAVFALVKKPVFFFYILWGLGGSLITAYVFQFYEIFFS